MNRREMIKKAGMASLFFGLSPVLAHAGRKIRANKTYFKSDDVVLFTGDSITDGARDYTLYNRPNNARALGTGYVNLTAARISFDHPDKNLKIYNTGINGDTIIKLLNRWEKDCLALKPTVLSILVGVNDFNVAFSATGKGDPERYEREYRELLTLTRSKLPDIRFVIGEPYAIKGAREKIDNWYPEFEKYREIAFKMAKEFNAVFVPYQSTFLKASSDNKVSGKFYTPDGIHTSIAGAQLMSDTWLKAVFSN